MPAPGPGRMETAQDAFAAIFRMHQDLARLESFIKRTSQLDTEYMIDQLRGAGGRLEAVAYRIEEED